MKKLMQKILGHSLAPTAPLAHLAAGSSAHDDPLTLEDGPDNSIRRQLIPMLLRDVMRLHGIPKDWIECQMLMVSSQNRGSGMYVRLVIREWNARLMKYAFAFQSTLFADILRFEPQAAQWLYGISWQLELGNSSPYPTLPAPSYWTASALSGDSLRPKSGLRVNAAHSNSVNAPNENTLPNLKRIFLSETQEDDWGAQSDDYEGTKPAPLR